MELNEQVRQKVREALIANRINFEGSDAKYAASFDINSGIYNRIKKGETERVMRDAKWITIARRLNVQLGDEPEWVPARTAIFEYITTQLRLAQMESICGLYCDRADIGKTFAAKYYAATNKNVVYVDCSQYKTKQKLIRFIAQSFGLVSDGKYADVYNDLAYYLKIVKKALIILDEAGDLNYDAFLELKALWNASEYLCGWYMMGAHGLEAKMRKGITNKKVGYEEIFTRFGNNYNHIVPIVVAESDEFLYSEQVAIIQANINLDNTDMKKLMTKSKGSHRSLHNQILKLKRKQQMQAA